MSDNHYTKVPKFLTEFAISLFLSSIKAIEIEHLVERTK